MEHKMKSDGYFAQCQRPGCSASIQGNMENWTQVDLDRHFGGTECPYVFNPDKPNMTNAESIAYILDYADKQIKAWESVKTFWLEAQEEK